MHIMYHMTNREPSKYRKNTVKLGKYMQSATLPNCMDCCCQCILFLQPDFIAQKSQLEEVIESCSHICDFYPKYHCELNFIEQFWGAAKAHYHAGPQPKMGHEMEETVRESLDSVPLLQIQR